MENVKILSFAKINLSIDVTGIMDNGMHSVDMVMHQIAFHDDVNVSFEPDDSLSTGEITISLETNRNYLPVDERNLAYKAAVLMAETFHDRIPGGNIHIDILKRIPVAAGLAGGSGNGAAVIHALNLIWHLNLGLKRLCALGAELGSDVPFCVMGQAKCNYILPKKIRKSAYAVSCARASGTGTQMKPLSSIGLCMVIAKPPIPVSTAEVYKGIDSCEITERPDNSAIEKAIKEKNYSNLYADSINVLEQYTLTAYPQVKELKDTMSSIPSAEFVLMSGSGPTVFSIYRNLTEAKKACSLLREKGYEAYWTKTTK